MSNDPPAAATPNRDDGDRIEAAARNLEPPARPDVPAPASLAPDAGRQLQGAATGPAGLPSPTAASRDVPPGAAPLPEFEYLRALAVRAWRSDRVAHAAVTGGVMFEQESQYAMPWPDWIPPLLRAQVRAAWSHLSPVAWAEHALGARVVPDRGQPRLEFDPVIPTGRTVRVLSSSRDGPTRLLAAGRYVPIDRRMAVVVLLWPAVRTGEVVPVLPPGPGEVRDRAVTSREPVSMAEARLRDRRLVVDAPITLFRPGDPVLVAGRAGRPVRGLVESMTLLVGSGEAWIVTVRVGGRRLRRCVTAVRHDLELPGEALQVVGERAEASS